MKAAAFQYERPGTSAEACALLTVGAGLSKPMAGGQSLGPMLNLRLAQPAAVIDLAALAGLSEVRDEGDAMYFGANVTHAAIEDARVSDPSRGLMPFVAAHIAYRAVRNRGTLGGSLAHADPAADWVSTMRLLDAVYVIEGPRGRREVASGDFMQAAFTTVLGADDLLLGVRIAKCSGSAKFGYFKFCRKVGEFAEAIGAVLLDPARCVRRAVIGATAGAPHLVQDIAGVLRGSQASIDAEVRAAGCDEPYEFQIHSVALKRAVAQALA
ncbi:MAG TPA: FAD binding domain-containing protein [Burkholderiales bacterium]|nr:FAD binding domain-containing protein [Burkholderiales bacterium]